MPDLVRHITEALPVQRWPGVELRPATLAWAVMVTLALPLACHPAQAAEPCPDKFVDVYLSPLKREEGPPIRIFLKPGPPPVHLRLPREGLVVGVLPNESVDAKNCAQSSYYGRQAVYFRTSTLVSGLGMIYDQPRAGNGRIEFNARDPDDKRSISSWAPLDEAGDREGWAGKGDWIVEPNIQPAPYFRARFCLRPPAPPGQCYASANDWISYRTDNVSLSAQVFYNATFVIPPHGTWYQITVADLDSYFALLRRVADVVVIQTHQPGK